MCGIAGFIYATPQPDLTERRRTLERMVSLMAHRGPDGRGFWQDEYASLGHVRLSIIDRAGGHQPMANEDGTLWISYNGEIFNHAAIRPELEAAGHRYQSRSDTETILHAFEQWGPQSLDRYRGMFSFVLWDTRQQRLFAARDRLGIKPFYYVWTGQELIFASEIKALLEHPAVSARPALDTLPEYLAYGYLSGPRTMFEGVQQLPPGHWLMLAITPAGPRLTIEPYWDVPVPTADATATEAELIAECRRRLEEIVELRLMSDVPLGMFLSGGVDSSAICALVKKLAPGPVKTFSVGYAEAAYSELRFARQVAAYLNTDHHEVTVSGEDFFSALPDLVWHEDEPITWPSSVPLYFVSKKAREEVVVVLTGEGADELFGGYARYRHYARTLEQWRYYRLVPAFGRRAIRQFIETSPLLSAEWRRKLGHTLLGRDGTLGSAYLDNYYGAFPPLELDQLTAPLRQSQNGHHVASTHAPFLEYFNRHPEATLLRRLLYADQKTYLAELLRKQDRMSMATSIESRVPLLDHHFVAFAASVPDRFKLGPVENKHLLKRAVEDLLPREIIYRRKMGFPTPLRAWLDGPFQKPVRALLTDSRSFIGQILDPTVIRHLLDRGAAGREDTTDRLWRLLVLELWGRRFFAPQKPSPDLLPAGAAV